MKCGILGTDIILMFARKGGPMIYLLIICIVFLADFYLKTWIEVKSRKELPITLADGHIELRRLHNKGLAGSRLENKPRTATLISSLAFIGCILLAVPVLFKKGVRTDKAALAMIIGGAAGNLFDRIGRGYVVDFITFPKAKIKQIRRFVYNLADLFIFLGSALLLIRELFRTLSGKS